MNDNTSVRPSAAGTEDNTILRAREILKDGENSELEGLIQTIEKQRTVVADIDNERNALSDRAAAANKEIEEAYAKINELLPENPLGNMTIGS